MSIEAELHSPFARELAEASARTRQKILAAIRSWKNNHAHYEAKAAELRKEAESYDFEARMARDEITVLQLQLEHLP